MCRTLCFMSCCLQIDVRDEYDVVDDAEDAINEDSAKLAVRRWGK